MKEKYHEAKILKSEKVDTADTLENLVANLNTPSDKRANSTFQNRKNLSRDGMQHELNAMYRTDWLSGKIVDIIPDDMTREWREFTGDIDPTVVKALVAEEDRIQLRSNFNKAHKWARLYGTAMVLLVVDDGLTPDKPLDMNLIKEGSLKHIKAIDRHMINQADVVQDVDPMSLNFGNPKFYRLNESSTLIHHSRVLRFEGNELPFYEFRKNNYNSDSVLSRLYDALTNFHIAADSSASMIYETNVDIVKVKGLMNYLQSAQGEELIRKRFALASNLKSFNNMMLLDSEEEATTKTNTFAGLPDLLDKYALFLSGASDIPATRLLGSSANGLNATGQGDLKNYYDTVRSAQVAIYKPKLDLIDKIISKSLGLPEDLDLAYEFKSLFQMTPKEESDISFTNAQRDSIYLDRDIVTEEAVAKELKQKGTYTNITDGDIEELGGDTDGFDADTDNSSD